MKIKLLFISALICLFGMNTKAQTPTFTIANAQVVGDSIVIYRSDTTGLNQGPSGANVVWNFLTLNNIGTVKRYTLLPASTPYPALYPSSNRAEKTVSGASINYQFYSTQNGFTDIVGTSGGVIDSTIYLNPDRAMIFPFTYLDTYKDSSIAFSYYNTGGIKNHSYHSRTTTADGYGTLILPNATYTNVLRYKVVHNEIDSLFSGSGFISRTVWYIEEYFWVGADYRAYLLYANPVKIKNGVAQTKSVHYVTNPNSNLTTGIQTDHDLATQISIFPNPSTTIINISGTNEGNVKIINALGQAVMEAKMTNRIDITKLVPGIYFVQVINNDHKVINTTRIIKE